MSGSMPEWPRLCYDCFEVYWESKNDPDEVCVKCRAAREKEEACSQTPTA